MDSVSFLKYVPAINAFLNAKVDSKCKTWDDVVMVFFEMNNDASVKTLTELANAFNNSHKPNFFRIKTEILQPYFSDFIIAKETLIAERFKENEHFIEDTDGLRITFSAMHRLINRKGEDLLCDAYDLIEKIYQMYIQYVSAMGSKARRYTHWTIIERISHFTNAMQTHTIKQKKMDTQPRVFCIIKGSLNKIQSTLTKFEKDPLKKYSSERMFPIYETVMFDANKEIDIVMGYLDQYHLQPYREQQIGEQTEDGREIKKLSQTKHNIRLLKKLIMIDPSQSIYTPDMLPVHIDEIRIDIKLGRSIVSDKLLARRLSPSMLFKHDNLVNDNFTDIEIFEKTNGKYIDDLRAIELIPRNENNTNTTHDIVKYHITHIDGDGNVQDEDKSVISMMTDPTVEQPQRKRTISSSTVRSSNLSSVMESTSNEYNDSEDDDDNSKPRGRTRSALSLKSVNSAQASKRNTETNQQEGYDTSDDDN